MLSGAGFAGFNHPGKLEGVFQGREQKWFAEQTAKTSLDRFRGGQDSAAGDEQDFGCGREFVQLPAQFDAIHARHFEVGNHQFKRFRCGRECRQRLVW